LGVDVSSAKLLVSNDDAKEGEGISGPVELAPTLAAYTLAEGLPN
jgi:hypothetical protein